ncbi:MAG TPA: hypothetical protein VIM58_09465, partial [Candidatus Methylacidiphilales bacterium]
MEHVLGLEPRAEAEEEEEQERAEREIAQERIRERPRLNTRAGQWFHLFCEFLQVIPEVPEELRVLAKIPKYARESFHFTLDTPSISFAALGEKPGVYLGCLTFPLPGAFLALSARRAKDAPGEVVNTTRKNALERHAERGLEGVVL